MAWEEELDTLTKAILGRMGPRPQVSLLGQPIDTEAEAAAMSPAPTPQPAPNVGTIAPPRQAAPGTFMGLSPTDWMQLIGAVGAPLQIGNADVRRRGAGIRPFAALGGFGQLMEQRQAGEREQARRAELGRALYAGNQAISNAANPEEAEKIRQQYLGIIGGLQPDALTAGVGGHGGGGGGTTSALPSGGIAGYLPGPSPDASKFYYEGKSLKQQNEEMRQWYNALPPEQKRRFAVKLENGKATLTEAATPDAVLAAESKQITGGPEAVKAFLGKTEMTNDQVAGFRNQLVTQVYDLQKQLMPQQNPLGQILQPNPGDRRRIEQRLAAAADIANAFHNQHAATLGLQPGNLFPDLQVSRGMRAEVMDQLSKELLFKNKRKPTPEELLKAYYEEAMTFGQPQEPSR